jgi:hypothetical protein
MFSYLKTPRTLKLQSKTKFGGPKYVVVKNTTGVSERRQHQSKNSAKHSCDKHNLNTSINKVHVISVKTAINTHENNYCTGEGDCFQDWNIVV